MKKKKHKLKIEKIKIVRTNKPNKLKLQRGGEAR